MKRLFTFFTAAVVAVSMMAEDHMKFKGIEIDGKVQPFVAKLQQQEFTIFEQTPEATILSGVFNGQEAYVYVYQSPTSHTVYQVAVIFKNSGEKWSHIWNCYTTYKERLQIKYGQPTKQVEENRSSYFQDNPLFALQQDQAEYYALYETANGTVSVNIIYFPFPIDVQVCINYRDAQNKQLNERESINDL